MSYVVLPATSLLISGWQRAMKSGLGLAIQFFKMTTRNNVKLMDITNASTEMCKWWRFLFFKFEKLNLASMSSESTMIVPGTMKASDWLPPWLVLVSSSSS